MKNMFSDMRFGAAVFPNAVDRTFRTFQSKMLSATAIPHPAGGGAKAAIDLTIPLTLADNPIHTDTTPVLARVAKAFRRSETIPSGDPPRAFRTCDRGVQNVMPSHAMAAGGRPMMMKVLQK